jgi:hypothetical protein
MDLSYSSVCANSSTKSSRGPIVYRFGATRPRRWHRSRRRRGGLSRCAAPMAASHVPRTSSGCHTARSRNGSRAGRFQPSATTTPSGDPGAAILSWRGRGRSTAAGSPQQLRLPRPRSRRPALPDLVAYPARQPARRARRHRRGLPHRRRPSPHRATRPFVRCAAARAAAVAGQDNGLSYAHRPACPTPCCARRACSARRALPRGSARTAGPSPTSTCRSRAS